MTYEFEYMMHLLGAASTGKSAPAPTDTVDWENLLKLAGEQRIFPLIAYALKKNPHTGFPQDMARNLFSKTFNTLLSVCIVRKQIVSVLNELEESGFDYFLAKGMAVADLYDSPECRTSADTDIYINPQDEEKVCEFFANKGFEVSPRWENGHHAVARHSVCGIIEIHTKLYDEIVSDVWFNQIRRDELIINKTKKISTSVGSFFVLEETDHLIYLFLHAIKHFIGNGMSIKMIMDITLFLIANKAVIDFNRVHRILKMLNFEKLATAMLYVARNYCGFEDEDIPFFSEYNQNHISALVDDIEAGGWMGENEKDQRNESSYEYNRKLLTKKKGKLGYIFYMLNWEHGFKASTFFPKKSYLEFRYPIIKKHRFLLPAVWFHRLFFGIFGFIKRRISGKKIILTEKSLSDNGRDRVRMFETFDIL